MTPVFFRTKHVKGPLRFRCWYKTCRSEYNERLQRRQHMQTRHDWPELYAREYVGPRIPANKVHVIPLEYGNTGVSQVTHPATTAETSASSSHSSSPSDDSSDDDEETTLQSNQDASDGRNSNQLDLTQARGIAAWHEEYPDY